MSGIPLVVEVISLFFIVLFFLHNYADFRRQNRIILLATFVAWYFSIMIVILLPMDISLTTYRQCIKDHDPSSIKNLSINDSDAPTSPCRVPWSLVSPRVFPILWRIIYWSSQALTWLILPFMQSFCQSGEFYVSGKLRGALIANAIYYGTYLAIFGILLIYVAIKNDIDGQKLKVIGITASNTWGLFLLVLLLGYGLVALPRSLWEKSQTSLRLKQIYFKIAKLHGEKCEAEENLEDILNEIKTIAEKIKYNHPLRHCVDIIVKKCPETFRTNLRRNIEDYSDYNEDASQRDVPNNEKSLVNLHSKLINSLQVNNRTSNQWARLVNEAFLVEDIVLNESNANRSFMKTASISHGMIYNKLCSNPKIEWLYQCVIQKFSLKLFSIAFAAVTLMVIWSEMTFFSKQPVLSIFAIFLNSSRQYYNYFAIEVVSCLIIGYLCCCAYYAVFKLRIFNYYYVASNHQSSENSLIFSGTLLCRLTSPLCYNFLGLMHLDSHITKDTNIVETYFTSLMGHMDVISFISDGFNIYFPLLIIVLCLATFFNLGGRVLHFFGFEQFIGDPECTQDLIEDGKNLVKREKRRMQRNDPEAIARHREVSDRLRTNYSNLASRSYNNINNSSSSSLAGVEGSSSRVETSPQEPPAVVTSMASSVKNIFGSKIPSFLAKKESIRNIREYRDIPSDQETDNSILGNIRSTSSRSDLETGGRNQLFDDTTYQANSSQPKRNKNNTPPSRNIFDDV